MNKVLKFTLFVLGITLLCFLGFTYISLNGTPWSKVIAANQLESYVESKYDIQVGVAKKYYNFKNGYYGAVFYLENNKEISFNAEKGKDTIIDYYPEVVWKYQLEKELAPVVKDTFSNTYSKANFEVVYDVSRELNIQKEIPNYKKVNVPFYLGIELKEVWSKEAETKAIANTYKLVQYIKNEKIKNVEISVFFKEEDPKKMSLILLRPEELYKINKEEDLKGFVRHKGEL